MLSKDSADDEACDEPKCMLLPPCNDNACTYTVTANKVGTRYMALWWPQPKNIPHPWHA